MAQSDFSFSELHDEDVHMLERTAAPSSFKRRRTRSRAKFNNGTSAILVGGALIGIAATICDAGSDWWVAVQSAISARTSFLFGDVYLDESQYGIVMSLLMLASGWRLAFMRLAHLSLPIRLIASILAAPVFHFRSLVDDVGIIAAVIRRKREGRDVASDFEIKVLSDESAEQKRNRAKWESLPMMVMLSLKIGFTSHVSLLSLFSIFLSSLSLSSSLLSSLQRLRSIAGRRSLSPPASVGVVVSLSISLVVISVGGAAFAADAERDGVFDAESNTPGVFFLLLLIPASLLMATLMATPQFTFVFLPFRLSTLKFFSSPPSLSSILLRLLLLVLLFSFSFSAAVFFLRRDRSPADPDAVFLRCSHFDVVDCGAVGPLWTALSSSSSSSSSSSVDPCHPSAYCAFAAGHYNLRVTHGRILWTVYNAIAAVALGVCFLASVAATTVWGRGVHETVRALYCDVLMTEAHQVVDALASLITMETRVSLRENLLNVEASIVNREKENSNETVETINGNLNEIEDEKTPPSQSTLDEQESMTLLVRLSELLGQINSLLSICDLDPEVDLTRRLLEVARQVRSSRRSPPTHPPPPPPHPFLLSPRRLLLFLFLLFPLLLLLIGPPLLSALLTPSCPPGLDHFLPIKGGCFHLNHTGFETKETAGERCLQMGAELAEIRTEEEMVMVESYLTHSVGNAHHFWTGLIKRPLSKFLHWDLPDARYDFVWESNLKPPIYRLPWFAKEPGLEDHRACVLANLIVTRPRRLFLYNWDCEFPRGFLCRKDLWGGGERGGGGGGKKRRRRLEEAKGEEEEEEDEQGCHPDFKDIVHGDSCYHFEQSPGAGIDWRGARSMCGANNSTLAAFETPEEWNAVGTRLLALGGGTAWIGAATLTIGAGDFVWPDHTPLVVDGAGKYGWWEEQPGKVGQGDCVKTGVDMTTRTFGWQTYDCRYQYAFLCERKRGE